MCEDREVSDVVGGSGTDLAEAVEPRISYVVARLERAVRAAVNEREPAVGGKWLRSNGLAAFCYPRALMKARKSSVRFRRKHRSPRITTPRRFIPSRKVFPIGLRARARK